MKENLHNSDAVHKLALEHARAMAINASDLRMKNFNFFLIIIGVVITAYANFGMEARLGLGGIGVLVSLAFFLLDLRGRELLDAAQKELMIRESALGISIQVATLNARKGKFIKKAMSHTFVYRAIYTLGVALSLTLAIFAPLGAH